MQAKVAYPSHDILGEGPQWSVAEQALYWVDIKKPSLQRWHPTSGEFRRWDMPADIGFFVLRQSGGGVVGLRNGFFGIDLENGKLTPLTDPEAHIPDNRFNDGKCDRRGRIWAGTLNNAEVEPLGNLYRLDTDHSCKLIRSGVIVSNGLGWSPDNRLMYYTDSGTQCIYVYDFDIETGTATNERIFFKDTDGYPDGLTVDSEGFVWSAKWDGWRVERYDPDGKIERVIRVPVQRPTSVVFGGPELKQLYITSARDRLSASELQNQPEAGHIFVVETETVGLPEPTFAG